MHVEIHCYPLVVTPIHTYMYIYFLNSYLLFRNTNNKLQECHSYSLSNIITFIHGAEQVVTHKT